MADPAAPILVGVDRSVGARMALARTRPLAAATGAPLLICTVLEPDATPSEVATARSSLAAMAPSAGVEVRAGSAFIELIRAAREAEARIIVVGALGEESSDPLSLGATTDRVAHKSDRPVLVVRREPENGYRSIVVGLDGSPEAEGAARLARELAREAHITAVLAFPAVGRQWLEVHGLPEEQLEEYRHRQEEEAWRRLERYAAGLPVNEREVLLGRPEAALMEVVQQRASDLLAVGSRGASRVIAVLLGSISYHLVRQAPCDVLVNRHRNPGLGADVRTPASSRYLKPRQFDADAVRGQARSAGSR